MQFNSFIPSTSSNIGDEHQQQIPPTKTTAFYFFDKKAPSLSSSSAAGDSKKQPSLVFISDDQQSSSGLFKGFFSSSEKKNNDNNNNNKKSECSPGSTPSRSRSSLRDGSPHPQNPQATTSLFSSIVEDNKEASLRQQQQQEMFSATNNNNNDGNLLDNRAASMMMENNNNNNNSNLDNREASLQQQQQQQQRQTNNSNAVSQGSSPSSSSFLAATVANITWCCDLIQRYPIVSCLAIAGVSRLAYRLRLFSVSFIHNSLPWIRFGSEVAATGGWMKLVFCSTNSIFSYFAQFYPAKFQHWVQMFQRDSDFRNNNNNDNIHASASPDQYLSVLDGSHHRHHEQIRAASASLSPGERDQLRNLYVVTSCEPLSSATSKPASADRLDTDEGIEHGRPQPPLQQKQQRHDEKRSVITEDAKKIDEAKIAIITKFKALPVEWRKQVAQISERHWDVYAMSLGVIPLWDQDLMNQLREAILFRPCPHGWKMKLFADEVVAPQPHLKEEESKLEETYQNNASTLFSASASSSTSSATSSDLFSSTAPDGDASQQQVQEANSENNNENNNNVTAPPSAVQSKSRSASHQEMQETKKKIIRGGIRFVDPRLEAPHAWHADNHFAIESIRTEAMRRLQEHPHRRRLLRSAIAEVNHKHGHGNGDDCDDGTFGGSFPFSPVMNNSMSMMRNNIPSASPATTTLKNGQKENDDDDEDEDLLNLRGEEMFQQLQVAAAESPQRLRSELMRHANNYSGLNTADVSPARQQQQYHHHHHQNEFGTPASVHLFSNNNIHNNDDNNHSVVVAAAPTEFDLTSPTRREIEARMDETATIQVVDNLLERFLSQSVSSFSTSATASESVVIPSANSAGNSNTSRKHPSATNPAIELFSRMVGEADSTNKKQQHGAHTNEDGDEEGGDIVTPRASASKNVATSETAAASSHKVVFKSSGKFSMSAATPRAGKN